MKQFIQIASNAALALMFAASVTSCKKDTEPAKPSSGQYGLWLQVGSYPNTNPYVLSAPSLTEGSVSLSGNGSEVTGIADYGIIPKGEYYYYYNPDLSKFSKFKLENSKLTAVKEVQLTHLASHNTFAWVDDNTLVLFGNNGDGSKVLYSSVNVNTLAITNGELPLDPLPTGYIKYTLGGAEYSNGKFYVALTYRKTNYRDSSPNFYVAVLNSDFTLNTTLSDNRSVGAGSSKLWMRGSFVDEKGDTYLLSNPTYVSDNTLPSAIYRIKSGATEFDNTYFFDTRSSSIGYTCEAMWYVGNGVAIVRYVNTTITTTGHNTQFAAINVADGTVRKILSDLPNDTEGGLESIAVENGKAYILVNAETGKDYVWEYDPATNAVKAGLEISGGYDYLLRLDVLK